MYVCMKTTFGDMKEQGNVRLAHSRADATGVAISHAESADGKGAAAGGHSGERQLGGR